jgi:hypothetical protein
MLQTTEYNSNMFRSFVHTWAKVLDAEMVLAQKAVLEYHSHYQKQSEGKQSMIFTD